MRTNSRHSANIQTRIGQLLFWQILLPLSSISLLILLSLAFSESQRFQNEQRQLIQETAARIDEYLTDARRVLMVQKEIGKTLTDAEIQNLLHATWQIYSYFNSFMLLNQHGIIVKIVPSNPNLIGLDMSRQPYFIQAQLNPNQQIISKPFRSPQTGNPTIYISQTIGTNRVLVGELSLKALQDYIITQSSNEPHSMWAITDSNGNLLAHSTAQLVREQVNIGGYPIFQGTRNTATTLHTYDSHINQWIVGSRIRLADTGWVILIQTTLDEAYGRYGYSALGLLLIVSLAWLLLVIAIRRQFNQQLVQPLLLLGQHAAALTTGQTPNWMDEQPLYNIHEIAALDQTFHTMQHAITQRENALRSSEARYRNLIQTSPDAIVLTDLDGKIQFCNQQTALLYGVEDPQALIGFNLSQFFPKEKRKSIYQQAQQTIEANLRQLPRIESPILRADGATFTAEINAAVTTDENDQPQGFIAILRDITPRKQLEEAIIRRERFLFSLNQITQQALLAPSLNTLLAQLPTLLKDLFDADNGYITRWNPTTREVIPIAASNNHEAYVGLGARSAEGSLTASVLAVGHPLGIPNVRSSVYIAPEIAQTFPDTAMLAMPLIAREQPLGAALIGYTQEHTFSAEELENASQVSQQIALAVLQLQLLEATQKQVEELRLLHNLATAIAAITDEKHLLDYTVQTIADDLRLPHVSVWLLKPEIGQLHIAAYHPKHKPPNTASIQLGKGLLGHIALHGNTLTNLKIPLGTPQIEPFWHESHSQHAIILKVQEAPVGLVIIESPIPNAFSQQELTLLETISQQISTALERIRLFDTEKRRRREAETLREATNALTSTLKLEQVLERILLHIRQVIPYDSACIFLLRENLLQVVAAHGFAHPETIIGTTYDTRGNELFEETMRTGSVIILPDARQDPRFKGWNNTGNIRGWMSIPLMIRGQIIGYMTLDNYLVNAYGENDAAVARAFANQAASAIQNARLFEDLQRSNQNLTLAYDATIEGWSRALELRDHETQGHTLRVTEMTVRFAQLLGFEGEALTHIRRGALLHDIGKMGVPDRILQKPGKLTPEEWQIMRLHPQYAYEMLAPIEYLRPALDIPYCHHEKWDGNGYPRGLKGEQIPIAARIFAIIDVWDALTSPRPYRNTTWNTNQALQHIQKDAGSHFDPALVKIFVQWRNRTTHPTPPGATPLAIEDAFTER